MDVMRKDEKRDGRSPVADREEKAQGEIRRITWIGLGSNVFISALKFTVGILGSSQAVMADAVHSLSDMTTDIAILVGVRYWSAPADDCHPYGHRRIETIITFGIGIVLAVAALSIGFNSIGTVREEHLRQPGWIALWGAMISILLKEVVYRWTVVVGRRTGSPAVLANAWHHRSDAISSIPAALAVALAAVNPKWSFVDHIGALVVSLFILHAAWRIMKPALEELADSGASAQLRARIEEVAASSDDLVSVHAIRTRKMGSGILIDLHVTVDGDMSVSRGHDVSEDVKRRIQEHLPEVADVVVHLEPAEREGGDER